MIFKKKHIGLTGSLIPSPESEKDYLLSSYMPQIQRYPAEYPPLFDLDVSDQKTVPSCVGHAVAGMKQYNELKEKEYKVFDGNWIYAEAKKQDGIPNFAGTYLKMGMEILRTIGAKTGNEDPAKYKITSYAKVDDLSFEGLKKAICLYGVVLVGYHGSNEGWRSEIVRPRKSGEAEWSHAVFAIGYEKNYIICQNSWGCFDRETEILTENGWKLFKDIKKDEKVATLNPKTHNLEYQKVKKRFVYDYDGCLWKYKARDIDLLITPNHKLYIQPKHRDKWMLLEADKIWIKGFKMKKDAKWKGKEVKYHQIGDKKIPMDLWLEFLGYFISEGSVSIYSQNVKERVENRKRKTKNGIKRFLYKRKAHTRKHYAIDVSQSRGIKADKIKKCLDKIPISFSYNGKSFRGENKDIAIELSTIGKSNKKHIPDYVKKLSPRQLKILFNALMLGDGSGSPTKKWTYYTSSKRLADDIQEILLKIGYAGDISFTDRRGRNLSKGNKKNITRHIEYRVGIKTKELTPRSEWKPKLVEYKGKVYCVEVPNHLIYVRRNGQAVWSGNSAAHRNGVFKVPKDYLPFEAWVILLDKENVSTALKGWVAKTYIANNKTTANLNVREQPTTSAKILKTLPKGTIVNLTNTPSKVANGHTWIEIEL